MYKTKIDCSDSDLQNFLHGRSVEPDEAVMEHVEQCQACQERLESLAADEQLWERAGFALRQSSSQPPEWDSTVSIGAQRFRVASDDSPQWNNAMARQLLAAPTHPEMLGRLGRYEVESLLGSGGMGIVFKAFDTELNRPVAVKLLAPHLARSHSARTRFAREARAAAGIVDDHVVPIYNVDSEAESPFLVMQYVAGGSLQQRLDCDGPLELCEILRIGLQTASGLAAAHAQGLIHRDVKPSNVLLDEDVSRALLSDFGLARTDGDQQLTHSGFHPGTPQYMSPEQVRGEMLDGRSDLFSLGCLLHALCTGEPPFRGNSSFATLRMITDEPTPSISVKRPELPAWLDAMVTKLLEKSPENRYQSAGEVASLLESCLAHVRSPATCPLPRGLQAEATGTRVPRRRAFIAAGLFSFFLFLASITIIIDWKKGQIRFKMDEASGNKSSPRLKVGETERDSRKSSSEADAVSGASKLDKWKVKSPATTLSADEATRRGKELWQSRERVRVQFKIGSALSRLRSEANGDESEWVLLKSKAGADFNDTSDFYAWVPVELASDAMVGKWIEVEGVVVGSPPGGKRIANDPRHDVPLFSISIESPDQMRIQNSPFPRGGNVAMEFELRAQPMLTQVLFTGDAIQDAAIKLRSEADHQAEQLFVPARKNFEQGEVYCLEISNIPGHNGLTLSPTLEVRAASPATSAYLRHNAVPFELTPDDLVQVSSGKFVTKVLYLPSSDYQAETVGAVETIHSTRLSPGIDPINKAEKRGDILLILRLGKRKPGGRAPSSNENAPDKAGDTPKKRGGRAIWREKWQREYEDFVRALKQIESGGDLLRQSADTNEDGTYVSIPLKVSLHPDATMKRNLGRRVNIVIDGESEADSSRNATDRIQKCLLCDCRLESFKLFTLGGQDYWHAQLFVPRKPKYRLGSLWYKDTFRELRIGDRHTPVPAASLTQEDAKETISEARGEFGFRLDNSQSGEARLTVSKEFGPSEQEPVSNPR